MVQEGENVNQEIRNYLSPQERFARNLKASMQGSKAETKEQENIDEQKNLFVDGAKIDVENADAEANRNGKFYLIS